MSSAAVGGLPVGHMRYLTRPVARTPTHRRASLRLVSTPTTHPSNQPALVKGARASRTTIALKIAMAVSGLIFVGFVLLHMYGNLKAFAGHDAFNEYAEHLRTLGEPMLPHDGRTLDHPRRAHRGARRPRLLRRWRCGAARAAPARRSTS